MARTLTVAGTTLRGGHAIDKLVACLEDDPLAAKISGGVENGNTIVALTAEERARLLDKLKSGPLGLGALRETLMTQLAGDQARARRRDQNTRSVELHQWRSQRRGRGEQPSP